MLSRYFRAGLPPAAASLPATATTTAVRVVSITAPSQHTYYTTITKNHVVSKHHPTTNLFNGFSSKRAAEPPFMVREDETVDPSTVKVPYLNDTMRSDIYKKHMEDPSTWSAANLSQHYGASIDRINGVIFLLHRRSQLLLKDTIRLLEIAGEEVPDEAQLLQRMNLAEPSLQVPPSLQGLYAQHLEDTSKTAEVVLQQHNEKLKETAAATTTTAAASSLSLSVEQVKEALQLINKHVKMERDLSDRNEIMQQQMILYQRSGVDVSAFRETGRTRTAQQTSASIPGIIDTAAINAAGAAGGAATATTAGRGKFSRRDRTAAATAAAVAEMDIPQSLLDKYFPQLIDDADVVREQQRLLRRIAQETQAHVPVFDMKYFTDTFQTNLKQHHEEPSQQQQQQQQQQKQQSMRWKFAFRDLSKDPPTDRGGRGRKKNNSQHNSLSTSTVATATTATVVGATNEAASTAGTMAPPMMNRTIIRTRTGSLRLATPLEESFRSWRPRPSQLSRQLTQQLPFNFNKHIAPYANFDGDDGVVQQLVDERRLRHQALLADPKAAVAAVVAVAEKKRRRKSKAKK